MMSYILVFFSPRRQLFPGLHGLQGHFPAKWLPGMHAYSLNDPDKDGLDTKWAVLEVWERWECSNEVFLILRVSGEQTCSCSCRSRADDVSASVVDVWGVQCDQVLGSHRSGARRERRHHRWGELTFPTLKKKYIFHVLKCCCMHLSFLLN